MENVRDVDGDFSLTACHIKFKRSFLSDEFLLDEIHHMRRAFVFNFCDITFD
jgi:hypothetical protein